MLAAAALYVVFIMAGDYRATLAALSAFPGTAWLFVLSLSVVNYLLRFHRWRYYLQKMGQNVPLSRHLVCYCAGFALTTTPGKAGEAIRSWYLKDHGVRFSHSLSALFVERLLDLTTMLLLALVAAVHFDGYGRWLVVAALPILAALPLIHSPRLSAWLQARGGQTQGRLGQILTGLAELLQSASRLLQSRPLYFGLGLGLLAWGAEGVAFYCIVQLLGVDIPLAQAIGIYALSMLIGALSFLPGGLGSAEVVMSFLLIAAGAAPGTAVAATLICRLATLWFAVLIGLLALAELEWRGPPRPALDADCTDDRHV